MELSQRYGSSTDRRGVILYVDDEEPNRLVFEIEFEDDFEVICAASGLEALDILRSRTVDVLVTDQRMPGMSGIELCAEAERIAPDLQRLLVTAYSDTRTATEAINHGRVNRYIPKPWQPEDVRRQLRDAIREGDLRRSVTRLQAEMIRRERDLGLAAAQGRFLHDLANVASAVAMACAGLEELGPGMRSRLPAELLEVYEEEIESLRAAVHVMVRTQDRYRQLREQREPTRGVHSLSDLVRMVELVAKAQLQPGMELRVQCDPGLTIFGDDSDIARILVNLITNAAQAMGAAGQASGRITLTACVEPDEPGRLEIRVRDDGPGVAQVVKDRLFEPFVTTRNHRHGSGMGLSICQDLAEQNGGHLELSWTERGEGTEFLLKLPSGGPMPRASHLSSDVVPLRAAR